MNRAPRLSTVATLHIRSTAALPLAPGIAVLLIVNTILRGHPWDHEWGWAIYQAGFVTVFLGPLCAGIGVWDGVQLARAEALIESSGRRPLAYTGAWLALAGIVALVYVGLIAVLSVALRAGGILDGPGLVDLSPIPGVLALCGAWAAIGLAIGYRWRSTLLAPIAATAAFGATLVLYLAQPFLVRVGGATSSILFLEPRRSVQVGQLALFGAVTATLLLGFPRRAAINRGPRQRLASATAVLSVLAAMTFLVTAPGIEFVDRHRSLVCQGRSPVICVASPYRDRVEWPRPYLRPYLDALDQAGIDPPTTFSQSPNRLAGQGSIPDELLRGHPSRSGPLGSMGPGGVAVLGAFLRESCDIFADASIERAFAVATWWLTSLTDYEVLEDPTIPIDVRSGDDQSRTSHIRAAFATLASCHG